MWGKQGHGFGKGRKPISKIPRPPFWKKATPSNTDPETKSRGIIRKRMRHPHIPPFQKIYPRFFLPLRQQRLRQQTTAEPIARMLDLPITKISYASPSFLKPRSPHIITPLTGTMPVRLAVRHDEAIALPGPAAAAAPEVGFPGFGGRHFVFWLCRSAGRGERAGWGAVRWWFWW